MNVSCKRNKNSNCLFECERSIEGETLIRSRLSVDNLCMQLSMSEVFKHKSTIDFKAADSSLIRDSCL